MELKFYRCAVCGQTIAIVKETGSRIVCCGRTMEEVRPGTADAAGEKHVPTVQNENGTVTVRVGTVEHPMPEEHYVEWIALQTKNGNQRKCLSPGMKPEACFRICETDEVLAAYAWCNLHSLWKT